MMRTQAPRRPSRQTQTSQLPQLSHRGMVSRQTISPYQTSSGDRFQVQLRPPQPRLVQTRVRIFYSPPTTNFRTQRLKGAAMSKYTDYIRRLFDEADDRYQQVRTNPVTGGRFMRGLDPLREQLRLAENVLLARDWFERQRPADAPPFPLTDADRERIKVDGVAYIVSLFARSLAMRDYEISEHPEFEEYARGVMAATDLIPDYLANDPSS
jgi:hypothetical protein